MTDVLVCQVSNTQDWAFLDGKNQLRLFAGPDAAHLVVKIGVLLLDALVIVLQFLNEECAANNVKIVAEIFPQLGIPLNGFQQTENIVLLQIPYTTLR